MTGILGGLIGSFKTISSIISNWLSASIGTNVIISGSSYLPSVTNKYAIFSETAGGSTSFFRTSTTGLSGTWSSNVTTAFTGGIRASVSSPTRTLLFTTGNLAYSDDNATWTLITGPFVDATSAIWDGTRFIAVRDTSTNNFSYSTDGVTWTTSTGSANGFDQIFYNKQTGKYIRTFAIASSTAQVCTGDPTVSGNWTSVTVGGSPTSAYSGMTALGDIWIIWHDNSAYRQSSDNGVTWTTRTALDSFDGLRTVASHEGIYGMRSGGTSGTRGRLYRTRNGINWTAVLDINLVSRTFISDETNLMIFGNAGGGGNVNYYALGTP